MFDKKIYIGRRAVLKEKLQSGLVLLSGNSESPVNYEGNPYRFRQDSTFLYYVGIKLTSLALVIDIEGDKEILFGNEQTIDSVVWNGKLPSIHVWAERSGIENVAPFKDLKVYLQEASDLKRTIHFIPQYRGENKILFHELLGLPVQKIETGYSVELVKAIVAQREVKVNEEIAEIEKAVNISVEMHTAAIKFARPGMREYEVAAEIHKVALAAGGDLAFPIIATKNGQILHNYSQTSVIEEGDLFLVDAGAEVPSGYAGDLSSTFPVSKTFAAIQKDIYAITLEAHSSAVNTLGPGVNFREAHLNACRAIVVGLKQLGLMKGDPEEALVNGAHALFFPCGTGHMLGLDVHDMENLGEKWVGYNGGEHSTQFGLKSLRLSKPLKPGFVLTIEPGIYFIPDLIEMWAANKMHSHFLNYPEILKFKDFGGIRNEEDVLITSTGAQVLGKPFPKSINDIELMRRN
ncbi:MAG: aminopeptidase P family protein [Prolixibacteraceae bacterium]|nr:aminopeptidase P family protein [Prolixibacteraceae bacterium]